MGSESVWDGAENLTLTGVRIQNRAFRNTNKLSLFFTVLFNKELNFLTGQMSREIRT